MTSGERRREPRFPARLQVRLKQPGGELGVVTETVSRLGFGARVDVSPSDDQIPFTVQLPGGRLVRGTARCVSASRDGVSGFAATFPDEDRRAWEDFIEQEKATGSLWRLIGRYATARGDDKEAVRSVLEQGRLGLLFKKVPILQIAGEDGEARTSQVRLFMVGENGEAYRVAFEKHPSASPDESDLAGAVPGFLELARRTVRRVLGQPLVLRRTETSGLEELRVVELELGGYAYVRHAPGAPVGLVGLTGTELIAVEMDGQPVFPFFDQDDLERIAADTLRRDAGTPAKKARPLPLRQERHAATYQHRTVDGERTPAQQVLDALGREARVEERTYGERTMRLYPKVWIQLQRGDALAILGIAMKDGDRLCCLGLEGEGTPCVERVRDGDRVTLLNQSRDR